MPVVVRPVDSEGKALFRLEDEIRKKRGGKKTKSSWRNTLKSRPTTRQKAAKAKERQRRAEEARKKRNGGRRSSGLERSKRKRRGRGERKN